MRLVLLIYLFFVPDVLSQACDTTSDSVQCSEEEMCVNTACMKAITCEKDGDCILQGTMCVADYCQPASCSSTGQCVHGQVCSSYTDGVCTYPILLKAEAGKSFKITFPKPAPEGNRYKQMGWMKGKADSDSRIVFYDKDMTDDEPLYYDEYCQGVSQCKASERGHLNIITGELTISKVDFNDEDSYYYWFVAGNDVRDTGDKYQISLEVYKKPSVSNLSLKGLPDIVELNTEVRLTCTVNRIKPQASYIFWEFDGQKSSGEITTTTNKDGKTFNHRTVIHYNITKMEHHNQDVRCTIKPVYGNALTIKKKVKIAHAPIGTPSVLPDRLEKHENQTVVLTYETKGIDVGVPPCNKFIWNRTGVLNETFMERTNQLKFKMTEAYEGNYTCKCSNEYGETEESNTAEVIYLPGPPPASYAFSQTLIVGLAAGVPALVAIVVLIIVIFCKRKTTHTRLASQEKIEENAAPAQTITITSNPLPLDTVDPYYEDVIGDTRKSAQYDVILEENMSDGYLRPVSRSRVPKVYHFAGQRHPEVQGNTVQDIFLTM